jgi:TIR domain
MPRIFLSFRKADERLIRDRLYQALEQRFGADQVFKSGVTIQPGSDYAAILRRQAAECQVMLVLIGKGWAGDKSAAGQRLLDRQDDWVRTEIAISLRAGNTVVPILVGDGVMLPSADELPPDIAQLARLQFRRIEESRVDTSITEIIAALINLQPSLIDLQPSMGRAKVMTPASPDPRDPRTPQKVAAKDNSMAVNVGGSNKGNVVYGSRNGQTAGRDIKSSVRKGHPGLYFLAVIIVVAVIFVLSKAVPAVLHAVQESSLSATSTCQQFLDTDEATEQQAIVDIADAQGEGGFGSPLALPAIRYSCSATPNTTLGSIIQRFAGQF